MFLERNEITKHKDRDKIADKFIMDEFCLLFKQLGTKEKRTSPSEEDIKKLAKYLVDAYIKKHGALQYKKGSDREFLCYKIIHQFDEIRLVKEQSEDDLLVERSPMRVSDHAEPYSPYPRKPQKTVSYSYNGGQRVSEPDVNETTVKFFLDNITDKEKEVFHKALDSFVTQNLPSSDTNSNNGFSNASYLVHDNFHSHVVSDDEWSKDAYNNTQGGHRQTRYSFSSTASTGSSASPFPSDVGSPRSVASPGSQLDMAGLDFIPSTVANAHNQDYDARSPASPSTSDDGSQSPPALVPVAMPTVYKDQLASMLDPKKKETAWVNTTQIDCSLFGKGDKDGDTQLHIVISQRLPEYIYCIVERLIKEDPPTLEVRSLQNYDALRTAVDEGMPIVAAYIAEAQIRAGIDVGRQEYGYSNTILHILAADSHPNTEVLRELLAVRCADGSPAFDVNAKNSDGMTPLHLACCNHNSSVEMVQLLLEADAEIITQNYQSKNTPIHSLIENSANLQILQTLLSYLMRRDQLQASADAVNRQNNTTLHLACAKNSLPLRDQKKLVQILLNHGSQINSKNINGQAPSFLVDRSRKEEIKAILHRRGEKVGQSVIQQGPSSIHTPPSFG